MNNKALTLSLVMAVIAVFFVQSYVTSIEEEARKKFGTEVLVVKAKKDIKEQETINETLLEMTLIPKRFLEPASVFFEKKEEDAESRKGMAALAGTVAMVPIKKGEQITYNKITEPSIRTGLSPQIAPGRRAVAIPVTEVTGVSKLIKPGDRIDVVGVLDTGGGKENRISKTILQDIVVLAVGRNVTNNVPRVLENDGSGKPRVRSLVEDTSFSTITIELDPIQTQALALVTANSENTLVITLRNNDDTDRSATGVTTLNDVLGADSAKRIPAAGGAKR